jgi:hypothetical protein
MGGSRTTKRGANTTEHYYSGSGLKYRGGEIVGGSSAKSGTTASIVNIPPGYELAVVHHSIVRNHKATGGHTDTVALVHSVQGKHGTVVKGHDIGYGRVNGPRQVSDWQHYVSNHYPAWRENMIAQNPGAAKKNFSVAMFAKFVKQTGAYQVGTTTTTRRRKAPCGGKAGYKSTGMVIPLNYP